ncbi:MAG: glutathione S-transferase family protein, partial [Alphaproteobacteria bacterium]|nr:glutathione S-transferase family protein [Alphaproteobacteria bacterium]
MAMITIHGIPQSTFVRTARMTCIEKGVSHMVDPLGIGSAELRKLNPFGKVPAMTHDHVQLFETLAICRYIDEAFDGPRLQPMDTVARARMTQWSSVINDYVYSTAIRRFVLAYIFAKSPPDRAVIDGA